MALGTNPSFAQVRTFFGGSASFKDYYRGGPYVPNIPANAAISTTVAGLRLTQFSGADKVTLPPAPTLSYAQCAAIHYDAGSADAALYIRTNGTVAARENSGPYSALYTWLPAGRSASEYQYRVNGGSGWSGWVSLASEALIAQTSAYSDGFYSDSTSSSVDVQLGAQGVALTAAETFYVQADAIGRG